MAMQKIQIADKPTLDEVATDVEALKELVTTIGKKVGVVELEENDTMSVIGGSNREPETYTITDTSTPLSYEGKGTVFISVRIGTSSGYSLSNFVNSLMVDGVSVNPYCFVTNKLGDYTYNLAIPFNQSISFNIKYYSTDNGNEVTVIYD